MAVIALCTALGLASVAVADAGSRQGYDWSYAFFWLGLLLIFVPICLTALGKNTGRRERFISVVLLGVALYCVKVLASPDAFNFSDEFIHWRGAQDILRTGQAFQSNPLLPTAAYYPGLASLTAGFMDLTGLGVFASGVLIIGVARVLISACLFLVAERVTGSSRGAAAASLIYACNPMFLFWSAAFSYENLALPLAAFVVWWLGRTRHQAGRLAQVVTVMGIIAVIITHHVVGFALTALLGSWWLAERVIHQRAGQPGPPHGVAQRRLGFMTIVAGVTSLGWLFLVALPAASYLLDQNVLPALHQTAALLLGQIPPRRLYQSGGYPVPVWEPVAGLAAVALVLGALPFALRRAWGRRDYAPMAVAIGMAAVYPLTLLPRLAPNAAVISIRSTEYVFLGLACVEGLLLIEPRWRRRSPDGAVPRPHRVDWPRTWLAAAVMTLLFVGNVTIGTAFYQRLPESPSAEGYPWSVQADVISASEWARGHLGIHQPFASNFVDGFALATYGEQNPVAAEDAWPIFFAQKIDGALVNEIRSAGVRYLLVDWRMTKGVPATPGWYFSPWEPNAGEYTQAFPTAALQKFTSTTCTTLVYNAGAIEIFDLTPILSGSCQP